MNFKGINFVLFVPLSSLLVVGLPLTKTFCSQLSKLVLGTYFLDFSRFLLSCAACVLRLLLFLCTQLTCAGCFDVLETIIPFAGWSVQHADDRAVRAAKRTSAPHYPHPVTQLLFNVTP